MGTVLTFIKGDITELIVDAIVNPANSALILGSGVAGAIAKKGGPEIQEECRKIGFCPVGEAVITSAGGLNAKYVIHAVGPRYGIDTPSDRLLYNAVTNALKLAEEYHISSIALPAISTGIFGYPLDEAAKIITDAIYDFIDRKPFYVKDIILCLYSDRDYETFIKYSKHRHES
ncbi:MAG: macro domain-containing protein [Calditerrivibrio sp.]|nr:macro domain-containing protein [Calditerrivibrio sp.]